MTEEPPGRRIRPADNHRADHEVLGADTHKTTRSTDKFPRTRRGWEALHRNRGGALLDPPAPRPLHEIAREREALICMVSGKTAAQQADVGLGYRLRELDVQTDATVVLGQAGDDVMAGGLSILRQPSQADLTERRRVDNRPCTAGRRGPCPCSRCTRAGAVAGNRRRFGRDDFPGRAGSAERSAS